jgi:hypothetical protein
MPDSPLSYLLGLGIWFAFSVALLGVYVGMMTFCRWLGRWWQ